MELRRINAARGRMALTEDRLAYPGYDEKPWAALPKAPLAELVATFRQLRAHDLHLLRHLGTEEVPRRRVTPSRVPRRWT